MLLSLLFQTLQHYVYFQCLCPCFACALYWWQSRSHRTDVVTPKPPLHNKHFLMPSENSFLQQTRARFQAWCVPRRWHRTCHSGCKISVSTPSQPCSPHCLISPTEPAGAGTGPWALLSQRRRLPFGFLSSAQSHGSELHSTTVWQPSTSWKAGNRDLNPAKLKAEWPRGRSVLHVTCLALTAKFPVSQWEAHWINALINGRAQLTQRSAVCQTKLVPSCKELCFCRWEVLSQVRAGPAAKQISPARIQSNYRPSTKPETVSSASSEPSETYVHKRLIWEGQSRRTSALARASSAQQTNYLRTSSRQVLLYTAEQIWLCDSLLCLISTMKGSGGL